MPEIFGHARTRGKKFPKQIQISLAEPSAELRSSGVTILFDICSVAIYDILLYNT